MRQTNLLLGEGTLDNGSMEMPLPQLGNAFAGLMPQVPVLMPPIVEEKKERKKRTHDPNAPKRPLTPYFLYMQTARPIIAQDLGVEAPKGAVQEEGQRRWSTMSPSDKQVSHATRESILYVMLTAMNRAGTRHTSTTCVCTTLACIRTRLETPMPR